MIFYFTNAKTVGEELRTLMVKPFVHPTNIPTDAVVYVDDINQPTAINGYRSGTQWYNAQGVAVNDLDEVIPSGFLVPQPYLADGVDADRGCKFFCI